MNISEHQATWDEDSLEVFRRMDAVDAAGHLDQNVRQEVVRMGLEVFGELEMIADRILSAAPEDRDRHIDTLLLLLALTPNPDSLAHVRRMAEERPDIYNALFVAVMEQKPLRMEGKVMRERIVFAIKRGTIIDVIYSQDVSLSLRAALESLRVNP